MRTKLERLRPRLKNWTIDRLVECSGLEGTAYDPYANERCLYRLDARKEYYPDQLVRDTYLIAQSNAIFFQHVSGHFYD